MEICALTVVVEEFDLSEKVLLYMWKTVRDVRRKRLKEVLDKYRDVLSESPSQTDVVQMEVKVA